MAKRKINPSKIAIWLLMIISFITIFTDKKWAEDNEVIAWDVVSYYSYLPSAFIYKDLTLQFTLDYQGEHKFIIFNGHKPDGPIVIKTTMGLSLLYAPFFLAGHVGALLFGYDSGGYSLPYRLMLVLSCVLFLWLGLLYLRKTLISFFSEWVAAITLILIVFGTNLFTYATFIAPMAHTYNFALIAVFVWLTKQWHAEQTLKRTIQLGLLAGLITLIRPNNILVVFVFALWGVTGWKSFTEKIRFFLSKWQQIALIAIFAFLVWIPQFAYWKYVSGDWYYWSYNNERFFFDNPQIINGLFSYRNGWLMYSPVMIFSLFGIPFLYKKAKELLVPVSVFTILNTYIVLSWWCWWYTGFGLRAFIDSYALLAIPLAAFIFLISKQHKLIRSFVFSAIALTFVLGIYNSVRYENHSIHSSAMTKKAYFANFFDVKAPVWKFTRPPDYDKAKQGIQAFKDERNIGLHVKSDTTIILDSNHQKTLLYELDMYRNDRFVVNVYRRSAESNGYLVCRASNPNDKFEIASNKVVARKGDWELLEMELALPKDVYTKSVEIFLQNSTKKTAYFDAFEIRHQRNEADFLPVDELVCDMEQFDKEKNSFLTDKDDIFVKGGKNQTSKESYNGSYSCKIDNGVEFGFSLRLNNITIGDKIEAEIYRKSSSEKSAIVLKSTYNKNIYEQSSKSRKQKWSKWDKLEISQAINEQIPQNTMSLYLWNYGKETSYFDDLKVRIYRNPYRPISSVLFDFEDTPASSDFILNPDLKIIRGSANSGKNAVKVEANKTISICTFTAQNDEKILVTAYCKGENHKLYIVTQTENPEDFYTKTSEVISNSKTEWHQMQHYSKIPKSAYNQTVFVKIQNIGKSDIYIDDLKIQKSLFLAN